MFFTVRFVTVQPRAFFDSLDVERMQRQYVVLERTETSFTDFSQSSWANGTWLTPRTSHSTPPFPHVLARRIDQQRSFISVFELIESWGASICFFYLLFRTVASGGTRCIFCSRSVPI